MNTPCCCSEEVFHTDDRYNESCFCEKCMAGTSVVREESISTVQTKIGHTWYVNLGGATGNDSHSHCQDSSLILNSRRIPVHRSGDGFPTRSWDVRGIWLKPWQSTSSLGCNCAWIHSGWGGYRHGSAGVDNFSPFYYQGDQSCWQRPLRINLELEELCTTRKKSNVGFLRRGLQEDMSCWTQCMNYSPPYSSYGQCDNNSIITTHANGYPCSPCYNNSGNVYGSIDDGNSPFVMDCENGRAWTSFEAYINTSPSCHPGSNLTMVDYPCGGNVCHRVEGEWDRCDDIADNLGGKYFWITDDIGEKYHVWFRKRGTDIDPQPAGSSGPIVVEMGWTPNCQRWMDPSQDYFDTYNGSATCADLACDIRRAIGSQAYDFLPPANVHYYGASGYPMLKWQVSGSDLADFCSSGTGNFPEALCTSCLKANHTDRVNGNQAATVYDGNTGLDFGDAGPPEMVGGWGNCCAGPVPRLFIEVPTLKEELTTYPDGYWTPFMPPVFVPGDPVIVPIGGTGESDCAPGDPLCICDDAVGGEVSPGGSPIIIDHGTNDHALYEYGLSGDFDCFACNTFTLRSVKQGANSDTSHLTLPNEVEVCPTQPCIDKIGFLIVLGADSVYGCPDDCYATDWNTGECLFNKDIENLRRHLEQNPQLDVRIQVVKTKGDKNAEVPACSNVFNDTTSPNDFMGGPPTSGMGTYREGSWSTPLCRQHPLLHSGGGWYYIHDTYHTYVGINAMFRAHWSTIRNPRVVTTRNTSGYGVIDEGCLMSEGDCHPFGPYWGGQCGGCGMPSDQKAITGGGSYGGVPIGITEVENCQQIDPDDQYYGWNKDPCCHPAGDWRFAQGPCGGSLCVPDTWPPDPFEFPSRYPAATHRCQDPACGCCCDGPLEKNICGSTFPQDSNRSGGVFPADCQRVTSDDIKAAWDSLTSGGTWIPERLHFLYDPNVTGHKVSFWRDQHTVNEEAVYIENQDKLICNSSGGGHGWKQAIGQCGGESPVEVVLPHNWWEDGYVHILDGVQAATDTTDFGHYSAPTPVAPRWVEAVTLGLPTCKDMGRILGDNTTYLGDTDAGCPPRRAWQVMSLAYEEDPSAFFDCPPAIGSPCWKKYFQSYRTGPGKYFWVGLKLSFDRLTNSRCCNPGERWWGTYDKDGVIRNHPINAGHKKWGMAQDFTTNGEYCYDSLLGRVCYPWEFKESACNCCPCDRPIGDVTFTIPNANTCWGIDQDGQEIEVPMPLGGTFTLKHIAEDCAWGAEFTGSFITEAKLFKSASSFVFPTPGQIPIAPHWDVYWLHLYHRDTLFAMYHLVIDDGQTNTWACSGSITLDRQAYTSGWAGTSQWNRTGDGPGLIDALSGIPSRYTHVCDPCSWEGEDNAFADFALNLLIDDDDDCEQESRCGLACGYRCDCSDCRRRNAEYLESINNASITLTSTDGTTRTYTLKTDGSADPSNLEFNWDNQPRPVAGRIGKCMGTLENFKALLVSSAGHDDKIVMICPPRESTIRDSFRHFRLVQREPGKAGNTTITYNDEFKEWCELPLFNPFSYNHNPSGDAVCPTKFIGGEWCESYRLPTAPTYPSPGCGFGIPCPPGSSNDPPFYGGVLGMGVKCYGNHPSSWPHSCPCVDPILKCLPETITVTA